MGACREPCDPFSRGRIPSFGQRRQHHGDLARGSFQTREGGMAPRTERGAASRASKGLDALGTAMLAIPNQRVNLIISDAQGGAFRVGTGVAGGVHSLGGSPPAFHLAPPTHMPRRWSSTRRGSGAQTTGGAIVWAAGRCRRRWSLLRILAAALDGAGP